MSALFCFLNNQAARGERGEARGREAEGKSKMDGWMNGQTDLFLEARLIPFRGIGGTAKSCNVHRPRPTIICEIDVCTVLDNLSHALKVAKVHHLE